MKSRALVNTNFFSHFGHFSNFCVSNFRICRGHSGTQSEACEVAVRVVRKGLIGFKSALILRGAIRAPSLQTVALQKWSIDIGTV